MPKTTGEIERDLGDERFWVEAIFCDEWLQSLVGGVFVLSRNRRYKTFHPGN
jgi:hypothetical protein